MSGSQQAKLRQGDVVAKKFEIEGLLGEGPIGVSYSARGVANGKKACVKLVNGPSVGLAQAQGALARIQAARADALVPVTEVGEHNGQLWVASEYFEAESLRRLMDSYAGERKSFSLQEACQIIVRVLEAVESAHVAGLVHRHIKPTNVLVHTKAVGPGVGKTVRTIRLTGLGYSELIHGGVLAEQIGPNESKYLAPELVEKNQGGTIQTDIYSVGVIFYELLCGQTPMGTYLSPTSIRDDLPKHVDGIVDIAMNGNAEDRYPTARDMINDVQRAFTEDDKPSTGMSKRALAMVVGGSVLVIALAGTYISMNDPADEARRADEALKAKIIKENPIDAGQQEAKAAGHPNMAWIPEGAFISGRLHSESDKVALATEPIAVVQKVPAFYIDLFEWPNSEGANPAIRVNAQQAGEMCESQGKRLCSALEWERACKGPAQQVYGYGTTYAPTTCGTDPGGDRDRDGKLDRASGSQDACKTGWGVFDMSGGTMEWTATPGRSNPKFQVLKGGKLGQPEAGTRCAFGTEQNPTQANAAIGFRCCLDDGVSLPGAAPEGGAAPAEGAVAPAEGGAPAPGGAAPQ